MVLKYDFTYNNDATASFEVNTNIFTEKDAKLLLEFVDWDYDKDENPIDELMTKYAIEAIKYASLNNSNLYRVINIFADTEYLCPVDGSVGVKLLKVNGYDFNNIELECDKTTL